MAKAIEEAGTERIRAIYLRHGYRLVRLHLGAMDAVFAAKPQAPRTGARGVPLQDFWELEKVL